MLLPLIVSGTVALLVTTCLSFACLLPAAGNMAVVAASVLARQQPAVLHPTHYLIRTIPPMAMQQEGDRLS